MEGVADVEVGVEPPAQAVVEALGAVDIGNGDDDDFELHVGHRVLLGHDISSLVLAPIGAGRELPPRRRKRPLSLVKRR
jgi:hypothetical protein